MMKLSTEQINWLSRGALLLTPNLRLSRALVTSYGQHQQAQGNKIWECPPIYAIDTWLQTQWQEIESVYTLLSHTQAILLWEQVISTLSPQLNARSVVAAVLQAYELAYLWQLDVQTPAFFQNENSRQWCSWVNEFEKRALNKGYISRQQAVQQLLTAVQHGQLKKHAQVFLMGFDGVAPLYLELLKLMFESVDFVESKPSTLTVTHCVANDADDEVKQAALYAKQIVMEDANATVGIIIPDLSSRRERIEKICIDVFESQAVMPDMERYALPFNFSAGEPLKRIPLVRIALQLFAINGRAISLETALELLKSPFIKGYHEEFVARALLTTRLLEEKRSRLSLDRFITLAKEFRFTRTEKTYNCPQLSDALQNLKTLVLQQQQRLPSLWNKYFIDVLEAVGYSQDSINSIEYQQREQFLEHLSELQTFDDLLGVMNHTQANRCINRLIQQATFQPKTKRSPVQVLGLLEGAGLRFTHTWLLGMHDKAWPPAPSPNPFIPYQLQREKNLPHATATRELAFANTLFEQYLASSLNMVVSYAANDEDQILRASPLIRNYPLVEITSLITQATTSLIEQMYETRALEVLDDIDTNPLTKNKSVYGGTGILKDQSQCAFRAFAHHRLQAKTIEPIENGLSKADRGTLLHACMQTIWSQLANHEKLLNLSREDLTSLISEAVKKETTEQLKDMGKQFTDIENRRLLQLIMLWLDIEKARPAFTVAGTEVREKMTIGDLTLNVYVDRIDNVNGSYVVIDYKTSATTPSLSVWKGERPDDPQLPLYAIGGNDEVRGIYFAHVTSKNCGIVGFGESNELIPIKTNTFTKWEKEFGHWNEAVDKWKVILRKLADDFIAGKATIDPTRRACEYCKLKSVCRIHLEEPS